MRGGIRRLRWSSPAEPPPTPLPSGSAPPSASTGVQHLRGSAGLDHGHLLLPSLHPGRFAVDLVFPDRQRSVVKKPSRLVSVPTFTPVSRCVMVSLAPAITAPEPSLTVPWMVAPPAPRQAAPAAARSPRTKRQAPTELGTSDPLEVLYHRRAPACGVGSISESRVRPRHFRRRHGQFRTAAFGNGWVSLPFEQLGSGHLLVALRDLEDVLSGTGAVEISAS